MKRGCSRHQQRSVEAPAYARPNVNMHDCCPCSVDKKPFNRAIGKPFLHAQSVVDV